jgi:A/G-specific adenine glycosylase
VKPPDFSKLLIEWYCQHRRDLPWRRSSDPYHIWLSEVMLQQTRVQTVIPYYERFLARFPTIESLASAPENDVLALWSGLGYYSRARNLRRAAAAIASQGGFPRSYEAIRELPGIGDYTAAAIASIAFGLPHAVLDGNVLRVIARVKNDASEITSARTHNQFREVAQNWLDARRPGLFNQAVMELGATVCLPKNPLCSTCPLRIHCRGYAAGTAARLPVKRSHKAPVQIAGVLLIVHEAGRILLRRRDLAERRMAGFWDLPTAEDLPSAQTGRSYGKIRHTITHHRYTLEVKASRARPVGPMFQWFSLDQLRAIPLSTTARKGLRLAGIHLNP